MRFARLAALCMLFCANCRQKTRSLQETPNDAAPFIATPIPSASADASMQAAAKVSAWTDQAIVDELHVDCGFDPAKISDAERTELFGNDFAPYQLTCAGNAFDQSCVYDPCFLGDLNDCHKDCLNVCASCTETCTSSCFACKANCQDDDCRNACAPTCAQCKQTCLTRQDDCHSGKCEKVYDTCREQLLKTWKSQNCAGVCAQFSPCRDACGARSEGDKSGSFDFNACVAKCKSPIKTTCDLNLCRGKYSMAIDLL